MLAKIYSAAVYGVDAYEVEIEVNAGAGDPKMVIVGLPDAAVKESKDRVRTAIANSAYKWSRKRTAINLAPADIKKEGPSFDLPIALGMIAVAEGLNTSAKRRFSGADPHRDDRAEPECARLRSNPESLANHRRFGRQDRHRAGTRERSDSISHVRSNALDLKARIISLVALFALAGCGRTEPTISGPLKQRGYVWQREWTPAVVDALGETNRRMDGVVILGAELNLAGKKPAVVKATIDWDALKRQAGHCAIAIRVAPFAGPFRSDGESAQAIVDLAKQLLAEVREHDVKIDEFQFDFDCAEKNLGSYRAWLRMLKPTIQPKHFVITVLPAWLTSSNFLPLIREVDGYVLQVHSVPISAGTATTLSDSRLAHEWVRKAAKFGKPFSVALPTYRCAAGYGPDGKLLSVAMDSVQPFWPPGTRILEFGANADEIAALVNDWQRARPREMRELLWYRVPIATDARNWRWPTLSAVMAGRLPEHKLNILQEGENPIDLSIFNAGEADEQLSANVTATWSGTELTAADALSGWNVRSQINRAVFSVVASHGLRLPPGATRKIGWLRFDRTTNLETELSKSK